MCCTSSDVVNNVFWEVPCLIFLREVIGKTIEHRGAIRMMLDGYILFLKAILLRSLAVLFPFKVGYSAWDSRINPDRLTAIRCTGDSEQFLLADSSALESQMKNLKPLV